MIDHYHPHRQLLQLADLIHHRYDYLQSVLDNSEKDDWRRPELSAICLELNQLCANSTAACQSATDYRKLPIGFAPIDLEAIKAFPDGFVFYLFDQEQADFDPVIATFEVCKSEYGHYLTDRHNGTSLDFKDLSEYYKGYATPQMLGLRPKGETNGR